MDRWIVYNNCINRFAQQRSADWTGLQYSGISSIETSRARENESCEPIRKEDLLNKRRIDFALDEILIESIEEMVYGFEWKMRFIEWINGENCLDRKRMCGWKVLGSDRFWKRLWKRKNDLLRKRWRELLRFVGSSFRWIRFVKQECAAVPSSVWECSPMG